MLCNKYLGNQQEKYKPFAIPKIKIASVIKHI